MWALLEKLFGRKQKTANAARDRLQIIIAHERSVLKEANERDKTPDYLPALQKELLEVLSKYVQIDLEDINISHEKQDGVDMLALNITLPENGKAKPKPKTPPPAVEEAEDDEDFASDDDEISIAKKRLRAEHKKIVKLEQEDDS